MTEFFNPEPMSAELQRFSVMTEMQVLRQLLAHLDVDGLAKVRHRLRDQDLTGWCVTPEMSDTRLALLGATCRRLVAFGSAPEGYFLTTGDMLPSAPDSPDDRAEFPYMPVSEATPPDLPKAQGEEWRHDV